MWLWNAYTEIFRAPGMDGGHPVCWTEMRAWAAMTRQRLTPWDARMIREIGDVWLKVQAEKAPPTKGRKTPATSKDGKPRSLREVFRSMGARKG